MINWKPVFGEYPVNISEYKWILPGGYYPVLGIYYKANTTRRWTLISLIDTSLTHSMLENLYSSNFFLHSKICEIDTSSELQWLKTSVKLRVKAFHLDSDHLKVLQLQVASRDSNAKPPEFCWNHCKASLDSAMESRDGISSWTPNFRVEKPSSSDSQRPLI